MSNGEGAFSHPINANKSINWWIKNTFSLVYGSAGLSTRPDCTAPEETHCRGPAVVERPHRNTQEHLVGCTVRQKQREIMWSMQVKHEFKVQRIKQRVQEGKVCIEVT